MAAIDASMESPLIFQWSGGFVPCFCFFDRFGTWHRTEIRPHIRISCHGPANLFITPISSWRPDMISPGCDDAVHTVGPSGP